MKILITGNVKKNDFLALAKKVRRNKVDLDDLRKFGKESMRENYARLVLALDRYGKNEVAKAIEEQGREQDKYNSRDFKFNIFKKE